MKILAVLTVCLCASAGHGQEFSVLPAGEEPALPHGQAVAGPRPRDGVVVRVDLESLAAAMAGAPLQRFDGRLLEYGLRVEVPRPDGGLAWCRVAESPVMEPGLQAKFPQIRTYIVQTEDGAASGRLELTPRGLTAMLRTTDGRTWLIDAWNSGDPRHVVVYWLDELAIESDWACHTVGGEVAHAAAAGEGEDGMALRGGQQLRTVRFGMACTGEWGLHQCTVLGHAPNVVDPLAAMVTVVSRTNVVYEADMSVHFNLVANNDQLVYIDPATDPYPTTCDGLGGSDCSGQHLSVNIENLTNVIGETNYDLGHLVTRIYGGVAHLGCICNSNKAAGISGIPRGGDIDPLAAFVVIHEIGHQLGANHTFSGTRGRCAGNVRLASAWEAGSGSSPMAYAGGCPVGDAPPTDNVAIFADPYFHHGSVREMQNLLNQRSCPVQTGTGNAAPVITFRTQDTSIPPGTPFVLSAEATDADGDVLTFSWEQFDSGVARPLSGPEAVDNGEGALFRAFPPVSQGERTFPRMSDVLSGVPTPGEMLPTVTDVSRRFRVIVRDNAAGGGAVAISGFTDLFLPLGTSPFAVVAPAEDAALSPGPATVQWTVGGTSAAPISCATVTIRLSTDDGATFAQSLGSFPNSGSAAVTLPELPDAQTAARIRIDADGQIFFAVSRPFTLTGECVADFDDMNGVDVPDIFAYLAAWFAQDAAADIDGVPGIAVPDIFHFLSLWFAGC